MVAHLPEVSTPLTFTLIAGGRSNLTFRVEDADGRAWALRRPPLHHVLPTAHDMSREYRLMHSLGPAGVPVPVTVGLCTDEAVNERPFYVMEFVEGHILRNAPEAEAAFDEATRGVVGDHMADTLAALHDVDPDAVGLGDLGRHEGYIERQLKRWRGQYEQMQVEGVDHGGIVERVSDELARRIPKQQRTSVVHGDYRMDNVVLADDGTVRAILDWEICTLGDPLADLGLLMDYWSDPDDAMAVLGLSPDHRARVLDQGPGAGALRRRLRSRRVGHRLLPGLRLLEARLHSAGRLRPLRRRRRRGRQGQRRGIPDSDRASLRDGGRVAGDRPVSPEGNGLTEIFEVHQEPVLREPILVVALEGWVDAGLGATTAIATLLGQGHTEPIVTFNGEHFLDQRARRPVARIVNGITTELNWPRTVVRQGTDESGRDMLFLVGPEPDFHWRAFTDAVVGLARSWHVRMVVGLGAFPAPAPHTRPVKLAATAPAESANLIEQVGIVQGELEVPAGVLAALEMAFGANGTPAVSLWARVPHYVAGMPFPEASAALIEGLASVGSLSLDSSALRRAGDSSRRQVDQLIADNVEHQAMVRKLEENIDASEGNAMGVDAVPSGDEIAAELERFLRGEEQ